MSDFIDGRTYRLKHKRKGQFTARVVTQSPEWLTVCITEGQTYAMVRGNERYEGDTLAVRRSLIDEAIEIG